MNILDIGFYIFIAFFIVLIVVLMKNNANANNEQSDNVGDESGE